jgi:hypothetical protein
VLTELDHRFGRVQAEVTLPPGPSSIAIGEIEASTCRRVASVISIAAAVLNLTCVPFP